MDKDKDSDAFTDLTTPLTVFAEDIVRNVVVERYMKLLSADVELVDRLRKDLKGRGWSVGGSEEMAAALWQRICDRIEYGKSNSNEGDDE